MSNNIGGHSGRDQQTNDMTGAAPETQTVNPQVFSNPNTGLHMYSTGQQAYPGPVFAGQYVSSPMPMDNGQQPLSYFSYDSQGTGSLTLTTVNDHQPWHQQADGFSLWGDFDAGVLDTYDCQQLDRRSSSPLLNALIVKLSGGRRFSSRAGDTPRTLFSDSDGFEQSDRLQFVSAQRRDTTSSEESYSSASSSSSSSSHSNTAVGNKTRPPQYTCPACNAGFTLRRNGERHKREICDRIAEGLAPGAYECKHLDCGRRFTRNEHLKAHLKKAHSE